MNADEIRQATTCLRNYGTIPGTKDWAINVLLVFIAEQELSRMDRKQANCPTYDMANTPIRDGNELIYNDPVYGWVRIVPDAEGDPKNQPLTETNP